MVECNARPVGGGGDIRVRQEDAVLGDALEARVVLARLERRHRGLRGGEAFVVNPLLEAVDDVGCRSRNVPEASVNPSLEGGGPPGGEGGVGVPRRESHWRKAKEEEEWDTEKTGGTISLSKEK